MQAQQVLTSACMGFLALVVNKSKEEGLNPADATVEREFIENFPEELPGLPPVREISFEIEF